MKPSPSNLLLFAFMVLLVGLSGLTIQPVHAAGPIRVSVDGATSGTCGDSWMDTCGLQYALSLALPGDELWVAAGAYTPTPVVSPTATFQLGAGVALYGGFAMTETQRTQRNWETHVTVLSGDIDHNDTVDAHGVVTTTYNVSGTNSYHIVSTGGVTETTVLDGFTVCGAVPQFSPFGCPTACGGGMQITLASPTVRNTTFIGNWASTGSGMYAGWSSSPTLSNVTFASNLGSALYNESGSPQLSNVRFIGNFSYSGGGMASNGAARLSNVIFMSNTATIYGAGMSSYGDALLSNVAFVGNSITGYPSGDTGGGGIYLSGNPTLENVTFINNTSTRLGGGMYSYNGSPILSNVTVIGNSAQEGGGIFTRGFGQISNATFMSNTAATSGGGIEMDWGPTLRNSIVWGNGAPTGAQISNKSSSTINTSIVQGGCPTGSTCTNLITTDPLPGPMGDYGGGMQTIPLLPGSPAIDTGNDSYCPATDQRAVPRPQGAHCDIGAFESRGFVLTRTGGDGQNMRVNYPFVLPLALAVSSTFGEPVNSGKILFTGPASGASTNPSINAATVSGGNASTVVVANGTAGSYSVVASGSGITVPVSYSLTNNLNPTTTTTITGHSPNPSKVGEAVTVTYTVMVNPPGSGTPSGDVTVTDGVDSCTGSVTAGICVLNLSTRGTRTLTAAYPGDSEFNASISTGVLHSVGPLFLPLIRR